MRAINLVLLAILLSLVVMVESADTRLIEIRVEGIVGPDVPAVGGAEPDPAIYPPFDQVFSEDEPMTMTIIVDMSTECDRHAENMPVPPFVCEKPDPNDCGLCGYYNGSVVALTVEVGDYRADYGRADPYPFSADALTYPGDDGFGYADDFFQYIKVHDDKLSYETDVDGEFVDHYMLENRLMYGTGADQLLTGIDYYGGDLGDEEYTFKIVGCSFAVTAENTAMFDDTDLPDYDLPVDPNPYDQEKLCRWAIVFGRLDNLEAGIEEPYKVQGAVTSYEVIESDLDIDSDNGGCFIATAADGSANFLIIMILFGIGLLGLARLKRIWK
jgi:hypothetical protein